MVWQSTQYHLYYTTAQKFNKTNKFIINSKELEKKKRKMLNTADEARKPQMLHLNT